jgi:lysophospholipase L1-like esterase
VDALVPRPVGLPFVPAPLLPAAVVAGLRGAAGLPDVEPAPPPPSALDADADGGGAAARTHDGAVATADDPPLPTGVGGAVVVDDDAAADGAVAVAADREPDAAADAGSAVRGEAEAVVGDAGTAVGEPESVAPASPAPRVALAASPVVQLLAAPTHPRGSPSSSPSFDAGVVVAAGDAGVVADAGPVVAVGDGGVVDAGVVAALPGDAGVVVAAPTPASPPRPQPPSSAPGFEFPDDTTTWRAFLDKVHAVQAGTRAKARVVQLGDSEIAGDRFVSTLRTDMAARIGLGGPGFALASPPWHWYRRAGFDSLESQGFKGRSFIFGKGNEGNYGPGGVAFDAVEPGARVDARLSAGSAGAGCTIEFLYATQPGGGALEVFVDDESAGVVELAGDDAVVAWHHTATACPRRLSARVRRFPARVFGWSVESTQSGIVWTSLGTVGANASALSRYAQGRLGQALALLQPDLVVATYGLNLTGHGAPVPRSEGDQLQRVMAEIRAIRPDTACLVMSPYPVLVATDGALAPSGTTRHLANVQRRAAQAAGCVFLDREKLVGGPEVALDWLNRKPRYLSGDYVHLTPDGATFVSRVVSRLLIGEIFGG